MKPLMTNPDIRAIEGALMKYKDKGTVRILEWGSGGSTIYFTNFLKDNDISYLWRSIEYNKGWYEKIADATKNDGSIHLSLFDVGNDGLKQKHINMDEYVNYPRTLGEKFDVIIVDGRKRRRCLIESTHLVDPDGVVFLHDAQRRYYQSAFSAYDNHTFASLFLWRGGLGKVGFLKKAYNKTRSLFFKIIYRLIVRPIQMTPLHFRVKYKMTRDTVSRGRGLADKIKILFIIFLLALKKRQWSSPSLEVTLKLKENRVVKVLLSSYEDAFEFGEDLLGKV